MSSREQDIKSLTEDTFPLEVTVAQGAALLEHLGQYLSKAAPKAKEITKGLPDRSPEDFTPEQKKRIVTVMKITELIMLYETLETTFKPIFDKIQDGMLPEEKVRAKQFEADMEKTS